MNRTILYYPTINIPNEKWLRHALLYWDEISSIVPNTYDSRIMDGLSPNIHYLINEGQFRPMQPEDLIIKGDNWQEFEQFRNEFRKIVESETFQHFLQRRYKPFSRIHIDKVGRRDVAMVHGNKTSDSIFHFLEEKGLAKRHDSDHEWLFFEKNTAYLYMSLLAKYLADIDSNQTTIGTDYQVYEKFNFKRVTESEGFPVISLSLDNVLPSPKGNVPFERIIDFKRKREQNLLHFKNHLSDFQVKVSQTKSQGELNEAAITFKESLVAGVKDLNAVLRDSMIESSFKAFKSLINLKSPTMFATASVLLNNKFGLVNLPVNFTTIGLAVMGTIELTGTYIELQNKKRAMERTSPFSYIYQAQKYGLVER